MLRHWRLIWSASSLLSSYLRIVRASRSHTGVQAGHVSYICGSSHVWITVCVDTRSSCPSLEDAIQIRRWTPVSMTHPIWDMTIYRRSRRPVTQPRASPSTEANQIQHSAVYFLPTTLAYPTPLNFPSNLCSDNDQWADYPVNGTASSSWSGSVNIALPIGIQRSLWHWPKILSIAQQNRAGLPVQGYTQTNARARD